ncbi:IclR family transcriptional regulator [Nocardia sp. NEAU-G5]|uniref:IclR family transcriptional regulator n=1 Tax=Nocardia albiluteola TaxID=2842303 RepID=A0ABS6BF25_9NOCA|nr:IclR family transcriptional regulator [Nocardia albiluteola]MBU3067784.1 IclR family transcriptional regulator [Nocardia albiluteola]
MGAEGIDGFAGETMPKAMGRSADDTSVDRPSGMIGAVDNVLRLLALFNENPKIRVNEASRAMGLSRSTVHRMLTTLSFHQFVEQDEFSRAYQPGPALIDIGLAVLQNIEIRVVARNALLRLRDETGETVHLGLQRGAEVVYIDSVESEQTVRTGSRIGWTLPSHATAGGKAMLAQLDEGEFDKIYPDEALEPATAATVQSKSVLREQLEEIRRRGYAVNDGESEPDVGAVAAAVCDRDGRVRGAISVTAPRARTNAEWEREVGAAAMRTAKQLGASFG